MKMRMIPGNDIWLGGIDDDARGYNPPANVNNHWSFLCHVIGDKELSADK